VDLSGDTAGILRIFYAEDSESATKPLLIRLRNYDDPSARSLPVKCSMLSAAPAVWRRYSGPGMPR
jgi:hypothetical protein